DKNVGTGKAVTVSAIGITGADAGNYTVTSPTGLTANITPAALGMTGVTASNKVYDALTSAALNFGGAMFSGLLGGDTVTFNSGAATGNFADKNVGTGKAVTVAGVTIGGADAGNYTFTQPTGLTADITPASMTVTGVTASNKIYDALTTATLSFSSAMLSGILGSDSVTINSGAATGNFANKNVGTGKAVTVAGVSIGGADAGNYTLTQPTGVTADITPKALTVTGAIANDKIYDATTAAVLNLASATLSGAIAGDIVSIDIGASSGAFLDKNVGNNKQVTVTGAALLGADAGNYTVTPPVGLTANITPASLTVNGVTASNKVYDALTNATLSFASAMITGVLGSDAVIIDSGAASGVFADSNVGTGKAVTVSGVGITGADAGNYILASQPAGVAADITPATLTVTADDKSRELSQPTPPFTYTATGFQGSDLPSLLTGILMSSVGSGAVPVGSYAITIGGGTAPNYVLNYVNGVLTVLADGSSLPPPPPSGGTVTTPNLDTQSSLLLSLANNQSGNFTITQPGLTAQGQQMYLNTSALNSPTLLAAGGIDTADMETRTYRLTPAGAASSINVTDDAAAAPVLIVPKTTAPIFPPTPFKIPEVMDI
ncbi:MAG: YDG domain-containing protein, partial [Alphaproteobacteria bacterium]